MPVSRATPYPRAFGTVFGSVFQQRPLNLGCPRRSDSAGSQEGERTVVPITFSFASCPAHTNSGCVHHTF